MVKEDSFQWSDKRSNKVKKKSTGREFGNMKLESVLWNFKSTY